MNLYIVFAELLKKDGYSMKKRIVFLLIGLITISVITGCGKPKVNDGPPKEIINTYLEGFRDRKPEKIYNTISFEAYQQLRFPGKLEGLFRAQDHQFGKITGWNFVGDSYIDEVNNQAIIETLVKTSTQTFIFEFDVRRIGDRWYVHGLKQKQSTNKNSSK